MYISIVTGCVLYGMSMFWCGVTSIMHLCTLSIERCIMMRNPVWSRTNREKLPVYLYLMIAFSWCYGFIWGILPIFGTYGAVYQIVYQHKDYSKSFFFSSFCCCASHSLLLTLHLQTGNIVFLLILIFKKLLGRKI